MLVTFALAAACGDDDAPGGGIDADIATADAGPGIDAATECSVPPPAPEMCDLFLGCGCDTAMGEKCTAENGGKGCGGAGVKVELDACLNDTECTAGTVCATYGGMQRCLSWCDASHACGQDGACYVNISSMGNPVGQVCGQVCDLRMQDCTFDGQGCYPSTALAMMDKGVCVNAGAGVQGDTCGPANDCAEGFTCTSSDNKCKQLCDRGGGAPTCATGTCGALNGHTATGVCQ